VVRQQGKAVLELTRDDDAWKITRPAEQPADDRKVPELLRQLGELKAERIVAYKPKDLSSYGLDKPEAEVTVKLNESGKAAERVLLLGKEDASGLRYGMVKGAPEVGLLPLGVVRQLLAQPLAFRDHLVARVPDADTLKLEAGERKITFDRPEGTWK